QIERIALNFSKGGSAVGGRHGDESCAFEQPDECVPQRAVVVYHQHAFVCGLRGIHGEASYAVLEQGSTWAYIPAMASSKLLKKMKSSFVGTHEEFRNLFELARDMLCIAGFDGYFKLVNPAFERVLGHSAQELTSHPWIEFVHPDDLEATIREGEKLQTGT